MTAHGHDPNCSCGHSHSNGPSLILVSLGNSRVAIASFTDDRRNAVKHFPLERLNEALDEIQALWTGFSAGSKPAVVVASVNPPKLMEIQKQCEARQIDPVLVIGDDIDLPLPMDVDEPEKVGTDRVCAAAAAFDRLKTACVVADFGTAVTIDLIADDGAFLGGTIMPGMALCAQALHEHTAQLPLVEVGQPTEILGKNTTDAIRNGIYAMMAGALREITERYANDIGRWPPLVVTGGDAENIARSCDFVDRVVPDLGLDGLVLAYQKSVEVEQ